MVWFQNIRIASKLVAVICLMVAGLIITLWLALNSIYADLLDGRKVKVQQLIESAYSLVARYESEVRSGRLTEDAAQQAALADIRAMRYGSNDYFWVNDMTPTMLMHPIKPELNGKNIADIKTPDGAFLFRDMVKIIQDRGGDFYQYLWPKPGFDKPVPKISYVKGFAPWGWIIGTGVYLDDVAATFQNEAIRFSLVAFLIAVIIIGIAAIVALQLIWSLRRLTGEMTSMASGNLSVPIAFTEQKDEVGEMSRALEVFRDGMVKVKELSQQQYNEQMEKDRGSKAQAALVLEFNDQIVEVVRTVISASVNLENNAKAMTEVSDLTRQQATNVATASELAATNVQTVAAASEELAASSREISSQICRASGIAQNAAGQAQTTDQLVRGLSEAASKIGVIVNLINGIAAQTNLLALNATIEAARAGDAGKGFAVVANEVKTLATQTAKATEEIAGQISAVQDQTIRAVDAISGIAKTINELDEVSAAIASAAEEQGAATQEITRNIQAAYTGTTDVACNIMGVRKGAEANTQAAYEVFSSAQELSKKAETMRAVADNFLVRLQSGGASLEWGANWLTGHPIIDADHKVLVQYVNELNLAMMEGRGRNLVLQVLRNLVQYTRDHFAREEEIWRKGGLSTLPQHLKTHSDLVGKVEQFEKQLQAGTATLTTDLMSFLRDWLISHVFKVDKAGVREIQKSASVDGGSR